MGRLEQGAITIDIKTFGAAEIAMSYKMLGTGQKKNLLINSAVKVLRPLAKTAKGNLKSRNKKKTGKLYKSIQVARWDTDQLKGAYTKARRVKGRYKGYHSHLIDRGTSMRKHKSGQSTGKVKGTKWWEDAVNTHYGRLDAAYEKELNIGMGKLIAKHNARNLK